MIDVVKLSEILAAQPQRTGYELIGEKNGCANGCRCGVSIYRKNEYSKATSHEDQEGFFVLEGRGYILLDNEQEVVLEPGVCFVIPAGTLHCTKKDPAYEYCKVFWFHSM